MNTLPSFPALLGRAVLPGLLIAGLGIAGVAMSGMVAEASVTGVAIGGGVGAVFGVLGIGIVSYAARLQFTRDAGQKTRLTVQAAGFGNLVLKMVGLAAVMGTASLADVKFPVMVALGVAFAAAAVCIQIVGSLGVARILAAAARGQARAPES